MTMHIFYITLNWDAMPSNQRKINLGFKESYANEYNEDFNNFVSKDNIQNDSGRPMNVANDKLFVEVWNK